MQLQEELLNSQLELVGAISSAKQASFAIELENINQAATLQKQLSDTAINDVSARAEIQRQLNSLGVAGATTDLEFIKSALYLLQSSFLVPGISFSILAKALVEPSAPASIV